MRIITILFLLHLILPQTALSQEVTTNKQGGISFRVDDNQTITNWTQYESVFNKYGYNFVFAVNSALFAHNTDYVELVKKLQMDGNELADHTPNHCTTFFTSDNPQKYTGLTGVDHITGNTVYLQYDSFDTSTTYLEDGYADLVGNKLISKKNGAYRDFNSALYAGIYLPSKHMLLNFSSFSNTDTSNADTLFLTTFWRENVNIPDTSNIPVKLIGIYDIRMNVDGLSLLAQCSLDYYSALGITRPFTWIQPGGAFPQINAQEAKQAFGINNSYTSAAVYPNAALKCYNEYNPNEDRRYATMWGDFMEDEDSFTQVKTIIADRIAKHYFSIGHSHFSSLLGGWNGYLVRMDSLLFWCKEKNILVTTKSEMTLLLYNTPQNPYTNIFPPLNVDLDENGIPDGYTPVLGLFDTTSGIAQSGNRSYSINKRGTLFWVHQLAGLEKGENDFYISTKGGTGDSVDVQFVFAEVGKSVTLRFPATSSQWIRYGCEQSSSGTTTLVVPDAASYCDVYVSCSSYKRDTIRVSGFEMQKKVDAPIKIIATADTIINVNAQYQYQIAVKLKDTQDTLTYKLLNAPAWLSIDQNGLLTGSTPAQGGSYPVQIIVEDQHANADTQSFILSVVDQKWLTVSSNNILLGTIPYGTKKDTQVTLYNPGLDTLTISNIEKSEGLSVFSQTTKILPRHSVLETLRVTANSFGNLNASVKFVSNITNLINTQDTVLISLKGNVDSNVSNTSLVPHDYTLYQNYPNPFNPTTTIAYSLPSLSSIKIEVFDILGRKICTLVPEQSKEMGTYLIAWSGKNDRGYQVANGVYFVRFIAKANSEATTKMIVKKMIMMK
jgi:hypothetical protein